MALTVLKIVEGKAIEKEMNKIIKVAINPASKTSTVTGVGKGSNCEGNRSTRPKSNHIFQNFYFN